ncbi:MAG TPA: cytochrome P450 [Kineosporiaceae bacterium]
MNDPPVHDPPADDDVVLLSGAGYKRDPYPLYRRLRERGPIHRVRFPSGVLAWLVTGYDTACELLSDRRLGKNHDRGNAAWRALAAIMPEPQHSQLQVHLLHQDPPRHTAMRRPVAEAFSPRAAEEMRPRVRALADLLVDALPIRADPDAPVDLVETFAAQLPFQVLAEAIGLPADLAVRFRREWGQVVAPVGPGDPGRPRYESLLHGLQGYIAEVVDRALGDPSPGLLPRLAAAYQAGDLSRAELDSTVFQLLVAGQEPVTNQLCTALIALFRNPGQLAALRDQLTPDGAGQGIGPVTGDAARPLELAVEELLRYDSAFELTTWRFLAADDDLAGTRIPAGDSVIVSLCAANRDERRFPDPDRLDLNRTPNPHLAFGHGVHFCAGAALARVELQEALAVLLHRLPGLSLAPDAQLEWIPAVLGRGVRALPVSYTVRL